MRELARQVGGQLLLNLEQVLGRERAIVGLGPEMLAGARIDQMHDEANLIRLAADAALDHIADVEALAELDRVGARLFQEAGVRRVQPELAEAHEIGDQLLGQPVGENIVGITFRKILEGQNDDRGAALLRRRARGLDGRGLEPPNDRGQRDERRQPETR